MIKTKVIFSTAFLCLIFATLSSAEEAQDKSLEKNREIVKGLSWLVGDWTSNPDSGKTDHEIWYGTNIGELSGRGLSISGSDTTIIEKLWIRPTDSGVYYIAEVPHNDAPVWFKMTSQDSLLTIFENPEHDFPAKIAYRRIGDDTLHVRISGTGPESGRDFVFSRNSK